MRIISKPLRSIMSIILPLFLAATASGLIIANVIFVNSIDILVLLFFFIVFVRFLHCRFKSNLKRSANFLSLRFFFSLFLRSRFCLLSALSLLNWTIFSFFFFNFRFFRFNFFWLLLLFFKQRT